MGWQQRFRGYVGHSSHVMNCGFSFDDEYLFSAGGADFALFQWQVIPVEEEEGDDQFTATGASTAMSP